MEDKCIMERTCVCVCVCVKERDRETEGARGARGRGARRKQANIGEEGCGTDNYFKWIQGHAHPENISN